MSCLLTTWRRLLVKNGTDQLGPLTQTRWANFCEPWPNCCVHIRKNKRLQVGEDPAKSTGSIVSANNHHSIVLDFIIVLYIPVSPYQTTKLLLNFSIPNPLVALGIYPCSFFAEPNHNQSSNLAKGNQLDCRYGPGG